MSKGTHEYQDDPRNANILIDVNGVFFTRDTAKVSVFDSGFVLGDGVWEGLRVHNGKIAFLQQHLDRLYEGAKAIDMEMEISAPELGERLYRLLEKNEMRDGVQDPKLNSHSKLNCITACIQAAKAGADEAFVTGTFAGLAPVREVDGRMIGDGRRGPMVERLQQLYLAMLEQECA
jgi:branched-subunit amino acid aminotransferase/4-amino-4-deoxychorismate lyase